MANVAVEIVPIPRTNPLYPANVLSLLSARAPQQLYAMGNLQLIRMRTVALFCSAKCPGSQIIQAHDFLQKLRDKEVTVIGGFHSSVERECLRLLSRGVVGIVMCPARSLNGMRIGREHKALLAEGRLLYISPFPKTIQRPTVETSVKRNRLVGAMAESVFVAHAEPGGKTEQLCRELIIWGKRVYTLDNEWNAGLVRIGAQPITLEGLESLTTGEMDSAVAEPSGMPY